MAESDADAIGRDRWQSLRALFDAVCELPPARQAPRLRELSGDPALIAEVEGLLQAQTLSLNRAVEPLSALIASLPDTELAEGDTLGAWRLTARLASGGMGTVFVAERADQLYRQRVAIKLLRGAPDAATAQKLADERQLLAELQHPGIARLYDGGTTPAGRPYLVMEYVDGVPLDAYCQRQRPGLHARIALFVRICHAVQTAHQQLIVHCDLKPANILVRADGNPVLLDFGIARLLGSDQSDGGYCTPGYASPEQLGNGSIGTASDVFSLGVVLTELLAAQRVVRTQDDRARAVPMPSALAVPATCSWRARLRGDLDAIAAKACALDPMQRYATAAALAADLESYLQRRPVQARAASFGYRLRLLLRRRWKEVAAAALVAALSVYFVLHLASARHVAEREAAIAGQVADLLVASFNAADPKTGGGDSGVTARQVLDAGARQLQTMRVDDPAVLARLRAILGQAYANLGQPQQAEPLLRAAIDGYLDPAVARPDRAAQVLSDLSVMRSNQGDAEAGVRFAQQSLALRRRIDAGPKAIADSFNTLGIAQIEAADFDAADASLTQALALRREHVGLTSGAVASTLHNLGLLAMSRGDPARAETLYRESMAMKHALGEASGSAYHFTLNNLGRAIGLQGRLDEAVDIHRESLRMAQRLYGDGSIVASAQNELGSALHDLGRWQEAEQHYRAAERLVAASTGEDSLDFAIQLNNRAALEEDRGDLAAAEPLFRRSLAIRRGVLPANDDSVLRAEMNLGRLLLRSGQIGPARALIDGAWKHWRTIFDVEHPQSLGHRVLLAELALRGGEHAAARSQLQALLASGKLSPARLSWAQSLQADLAVAEGAADVALDWRRRALETLQTTRGAGHVETAKRRVAYAAALLDAGRTAAARVEFAACAPLLRERLAPTAALRARLDALEKRLNAGVN